jgi:hypothetical protein
MYNYSWVISVTCGDKMEKKGVLTKILAIIGTVLVWFPILASVLFSIEHLIRSGNLRFDYLMPAELFLFALAGGGLLIWAALRGRSRLGIICWSFGIAVVVLFGSQGLAVVTGVASGKAELTGGLFAILIGSIVVYALALILTGVGGILLLRDLFRPLSPVIPTV